MELQTADYVLGGFAIAMAVLGLFRGLSGTLAFFAAAAAASVGGSACWAASASVTQVVWQRGALTLVGGLLVFGAVRIVCKKLVNGLLAQPADALFGLVLGLAFGLLPIVVWAYTGLYPGYSNIVQEAARYVR